MPWKALTDRLREEPPVPSPSSIAFPGGTVSWTEDHFLVEHDAAGTLRITPSMAASIKVSRSKGVIQAAWRAKTVDRLHVVIRGPGQIQLSLLAVAPEAFLAGLPELDERGAELPLDDVIAILDVARFFAEMAHFGAPDAPRNAPLPVDDGEELEPLEPAPPSPPTLLQRIRNGAMEHPEIVLGAAVFVVAMAVIWIYEALGPQDGDPVGDRAQCENAHAKRVTTLRVTRGGERPLLAVSDEPETSWEVHHGEGTRQEHEYCARVRVYDPVDGREVAEEVLVRAQDRRPTIDILATSHGGVWVSHSDGIELLDSETLATRESIEALGGEIGGLANDALRNGHVRFYPNGDLALQSLDGAWHRLDAATSNLAVTDELGEASFMGQDNRACAVSLTWGINVFDAKGWVWSLNPLKEDDTSLRTLELADGVRPWAFPLFHPNVLDTRGNAVCADLGLSDSVLAHHYPTLEKDPEARKLTLIGLDGEIRWTIDMPGENDVVPIDTVGEVIIVHVPPPKYGEAGHVLLGLAVESGEEKWRAQL